MTYICTPDTMNPYHGGYFYVQHSSPNLYPINFQDSSNKPI